MFDQLSKIGKQIGGDLNKALHNPLSPETWSIGSKAASRKTEATNFLTPASLVAEHDDEKEAILQGLEAKYYQHDFEPLLYELQSLPVDFNNEALEGTAEARTGVLEVCKSGDTDSRNHCGSFHITCNMCRLLVSCYLGTFCSTMTNLWKASPKLAWLKMIYRYRQLNNPMIYMLRCSIPLYMN